MSTDLPIPTGAEVRAAREAAGHTQTQAAEIMGYGSFRRLSEIESGRVAVDPVRWWRYQLVTGRHPEMRLVRKPSGD